MNTDQLPLSEVTTQLTKTDYSFTLPPLTPEQIERAREHADKVLEWVFESKVVDLNSKQEN